MIQPATLCECRLERSAILEFLTGVPRKMADREVRDGPDLCDECARPAPQPNE